MKTLNRENNEAMEFAYGMGLHREDREEENDSAVSFAYAMGLKRYLGGLGSIERHNHVGKQVAEPRFA